MHDPGKILKLTWNEMDTLHRKVADEIRSCGFRIDVIIGVLRCGMVSAVHLAYILSIERVEGVWIRTTPSDEVLVSKNCEPTIEWHLPYGCLKNRSVLLVDTVMASGASILLAQKEIEKAIPSELKTAIIVDWPNSPYKNKLGHRPKVDFIGDVVNKWPDFPWEH